MLPIYKRILENPNNLNAIRIPIKKLRGESSIDRLLHVDTLFKFLLKLLSVVKWQIKKKHLV
jgi:hypothetical protein